MPTQRIMDQKQDSSTWMCLNHPRFVFSIYQSIKHRVELKLSRHLSYCAMSNHFPVFFLALFSLIKGELSEQGRRQIATEETNKGL